MGVINVKFIHNASGATVTVTNREHPADTDGGKGVLQPGETHALEMWVPQCGDGAGFATKHVDVVVGDRTFTVWQASRGDGDRVRVSTNGAWADPGTPIGAFAAVGIVESVIGDDRVLIVNDASLWLLPLTLIGLVSLLTNAVATDGLAICDAAAPRTVPSVPKFGAVAFSMAGIPSDAFDRREPEARFRYRDSGKRYAYAIAGGAVHVDPAPAVPAAPLSTAISYDRLRRGEPVAPLPVFDLIAANGGRVFAKEKDTDRFYFAVVDEMFVTLDAHAGREVAVPSSYFKLDPEFNLAGARSADVLAHLVGDFGGHPAANRFPLYRLALEFKLAPTFTVAVKRGVWHLIDTRPPLMDVQIVAGDAASALASLASALHRIGGGYGMLGDACQRIVDLVRDALPATPAPAYDHVRYCAKNPALAPVWQQSIDMALVLDIGVGHVHLHEQYEKITGGELQSLLGRPQSASFNDDPVAVYQFMNGPVADLDGYNDGTCNYYVLARLRDGSFAVLFLDEQSYFSGRWRLADPSDRHGVMFALASDLAANVGPGGKYDWEPAKFWSPFHANGAIGVRSRMAVSAQVLLVTGDPADGSAPLIFSINFSWGTMDRSWRWRALPAAAAWFADPAVETVAPASGDVAYPQSIRLRGDMTIAVKGRQAGVEGRWCHRYLPASNEVVPPAGVLVAGQRPSTGYAHPWRFVGEQAYAFADRFSHFGVYDTVNSRTKYYPVDVNPADEAVLQALDARHDTQWWADTERRLAITAFDFRMDQLNVPWPPALPSPKRPLAPASLYNDATLLRIVKRGTRWIAMHWDKRDDDMVPMDVLPAGVTLVSKAGDQRVVVTLHPAVVLAGPPVVRTAYFWWDAPDTAAIAFTRPPAPSDGDNVWSCKMAAFDTSGNVVVLVVVTFDQMAFDAAANAYAYRWTPPADQAAQLRTYATAAAVVTNGTSVWFRDVTGHVAPPESLRFTKPPVMRVTVAPAQIPYGIATNVTVHAVDANDGHAVAGTVVLEDAVVPRPVTDQPFTRTFAPVAVNADDPAGGWDPTDRGGPLKPPKPVKGDVRPPVGTVSAAGYPDAPVPFAFYQPALSVRVDAAPVRAGNAQLVVYAQDDRTHQPVAATVTIGQSKGTANTASAYALAGGANTGTVTFSGYLPASFIVTAYVPAMRVSVDDAAPATGRPVTVLVHAVDASTGAPVAGARVVIDGRDAGAANAPFSYTFRTRFSGPLHDRTIIYPTGMVTAPGYPSADVPFEFPEI